MTQSALTIRALTKADRCDKCGAAAQVGLHFKSGELFFCGHHYAEHHPALLSSGAIICASIQEET